MAPGEMHTWALVSPGDSRIIPSTMGILPGPRPHQLPPISSVGEVTESGHRVGPLYLGQLKSQGMENKHLQEAR